MRGFQSNAFQNTAFQNAGASAFQEDAFSYDAFQEDPSGQTYDTHDGGLPKKKKIHLPEYFTSPKEIPPVIPEQWIEEPLELQEQNIEAPRELIKYDIDWELVNNYAIQTQQNLSAIVDRLELARIEYERALYQEEQDFMMMALSIIH